MSLVPNALELWTLVTRLFDLENGGPRIQRVEVTIAVPFGGKTTYSREEDRDERTVLLRSGYDSRRVEWQGPMRYYREACVEYVDRRWRDGSLMIGKEPGRIEQAAIASRETRSRVAVEVARFAGKPNDEATREELKATVATILAAGESEAARVREAMGEAIAEAKRPNRPYGAPALREWKAPPSEDPAWQDLRELPQPGLRPGEEFDETKHPARLDPHGGDPEK